MNAHALGRYTALLHGAGLKSTVSRIRVLRLFSASKKPLRIKDVFEKLRAKDMDIDMVTIYRTIEILCKNNIVHRVDFCEDSAYYELTNSKHDHHHITCTNCYKRADVDFCLFAEHEKRLHKAVPLFATITRHSVEFFGLCKKCYKQDQK
jgi:Fur family zinc uptake transcriptional regulator